MRLRVLGCSGGIEAGARTTSFLLDHDILLDAGTGVQDLDLTELAAIDHIFITHSHLDHITSLPLLIDSVGNLRDKPLVVHALPETLEALKTHIFNWVIWPDFTQIPSPEQPWLVFAPFALGDAIELQGRVIRALPANHTVPAVGFLVSSGQASLAFTGDTGPNDAFWAQLNQVANLRYLIIENAFSNREESLARASRHLFPIQLGEELDKLTHHTQVLITHLKPSDRATIAREVLSVGGRFAPRILQTGDVFEF